MSSKWHGPTRTYWNSHNYRPRSARVIYSSARVIYSSTRVNNCGNLSSCLKAPQRFCCFKAQMTQFLEENSFFWRSTKLMFPRSALVVWRSKQALSFLMAWQGLVRSKDCSKVPHTDDFSVWRPHKWTVVQGSWPKKDIFAWMPHKWLYQFEGPTNEPCSSGFMAKEGYICFEGPTNDLFVWRSHKWLVHLKVPQMNYSFEGPTNDLFVWRSHKWLIHLKDLFVWSFQKWLIHLKDLFVWSYLFIWRTYSFEGPTNDLMLEGLSMDLGRQGLSCF
jgi:hypothetical protein